MMNERMKRCRSWAAILNTYDCSNWPVMHTMIMCKPVPFCNLVWGAWWHHQLLWLWGDQAGQSPSLLPRHRDLSGWPTILFALLVKALEQRQLLTVFSSIRQMYNWLWQDVTVHDGIMIATDKHVCLTAAIFGLLYNQTGHSLVCSMNIFRAAFD